MKRINKGNENIVKIICSNKITNKEKRMSVYSYLFLDNCVYLIANILTGEIFNLTEEEYTAILKIYNKPVNTDYIRENGLELLLNNRFIVDIDYNEISKYKSTLKILKTIYNNKSGIKTYTILPTTACNARCIYCYENNYKIKNMTFEIADKVIEYINKTKRNDEIKLRWFGGEPLVGKEIISYICRGLTKRNIMFNSTMVSNGSLFNEKIIIEALTEWNLKKVQISLDGEKKDYEERKNYINPTRDNYDTVIENIKRLAKNGIKVTMRCNYDMNNLQGLKIMINDLSEKLSEFNNISLYFHIIFQNNEANDFSEQIAAIDEIYNYAIYKKLNVGGKKPKGLIVNLCMADNMDECVVIDPEGLLFSCEHMPEKSSWGNIFDGITNLDKYEELRLEKSIESECEQCCFLPMCTSFRKKGCPNSHKNCYKETKSIFDRQLINLINDLKDNGEL